MPETLSNSAGRRVPLNDPRSPATIRASLKDPRKSARPVRPALIAAIVLFTVAGCAARSRPPKAAGRGGVFEIREGLASYYGPGFHGKVTASGARFDMYAMVAAHPTYPFGTIVRVTNLINGKTVRVRILDRGPAAEPRSAGVLIDLSYAAARALGFVQNGRTRVRLEVLRWGG